MKVKSTSEISIQSTQDNGYQLATEKIAQYISDNNIANFHYEESSGWYIYDNILYDGTSSTSSVNKWGIDMNIINCVYSNHIVLTVNFDNPEQFEILSLTINNKKYQTYQFSKTSTSTKIDIPITDYETITNFGITDFTIDSIKYVDGSEIKNVKMDADTTIKLNIYNYDDSTAKNGSICPTLNFGYVGGGFLVDNKSQKTITNSKISFNIEDYSENSDINNIQIYNRINNGKVLLGIITDSEYNVLAYSELNLDDKEFSVETVEINGTFTKGTSYFFHYAIIYAYNIITDYNSNDSNFGPRYVERNVLHYQGKQLITIPTN